MNLKENFKIQLWISVQLIILAYTIYNSFHFQYENIVHFFLAIESLIVFPASIPLLVTNENLLQNLIFANDIEQSIFISINWIIFFIIGYLQWFVLIPNLIKKCKVKCCLVR